MYQCIHCTETHFSEVRKCQHGETVGQQQNIDSCQIHQSCLEKMQSKDNDLWVEEESKKKMG